jgi:hypothetical protein
MDRYTRHALLLLLAFGAALTACALDSSWKVPVPGGMVPTATMMPATPTEPAARETTADIIVGVWTAIDGALHLQFFSDGRFVRHYGGREDDPEEFWGQKGAYRVTSRESLVIEVAGVEASEFEYRVEEPWLMLRDEDGKVMRFRRNVGLMETY